MKYLLNILLALFALTACEGPPTQRLARYSVHGIDISHYQSRINWAELDTLSIHFAFVKATEGISYTDSLFERNWTALDSIGIRRGAYHFFRPESPPGEQARHFVRTVSLQPGDLPPVLDIELIGSLPKYELVRRLRIWLDIVENNMGVRPIIYTNLYFYNRHLAGYFPGYPLWIARYHGREPMLADGSDWAFWQYGKQGRLSGIRGHVDFNVFNGTLEQLDSLRIPQGRELSEWLW